MDVPLPPPPHIAGRQPGGTDDRADDRADDMGGAPPPPPRGWRWRALLVAAAVAILVALLVWRARSSGPTTPAAAPPRVTVLVPGRSPTRAELIVIGTIHARRDMPVGVVGEGGMIRRIRVEAGAHVRAGEILADIDSSLQEAQLQQLDATARQAAADARLAQNELDRALSLKDRGFVSNADIDRKTATRDSANAHVDVVRAQVREMRERLNRLLIRAPEAGLVLERNVEPGQIVGPGSGTLYRIAAGGAMELRAEVAEQDMARLAVGETALITPSGSSRSVSGTIWLLEPAIDPETRQGIVRIALPEAADIRAGGFAEARIQGPEAVHPELPQSAVLSDRDGPYVLVVGADDRVRRVAVTAGAASAGGVAILSGLSGNERVVRSAGAFLDAGEKVTPVADEPPATPAGG